MVTETFSRSSEPKERRGANYTFQSMDDLTKFFSGLLMPETVSAVIETARKQFVVRAHCSRNETRLQLIRKCESMLLKTLKEIRTSSDI